MAGINKIGYSTHILGTVRSVMSCLGIILYDKYGISDGNKYKRISLYNLDEMYDLVMSGDHLELTRENTDDYFRYLHENGHIDGFNVIIYINPSDGSPIGYTEFTNTQGEKRDTNIYLKITASVEDFDVVLNDNLDNVKQAKKTYVGNELKDYTGSKTIQDDLKEVQGGNKHYTKLLSQASETQDSILLDCGTVTKMGYSDSLGLMKLSLERNLNYSPQIYDFTNFGISYYGDDIVLCTWKNTNYCVSSLTQRNCFGDLIKYTKSNTGYFTLPIDSYTNTIDHVAGKYIICKSSLNGSSIMRAFNIEKRDWETTQNPTLFVDPLDKSGKLYSIPRSIKPGDFYKYLPELKNIFYDYKENEYIKVLRKIGNWFVLRVNRGDTSLILVTGTALTLYLTEEQLEDLLFFDDNTLILNSESYYIIYQGIGRTLCTEEASEFLGDIDTESIKVSKTSELYTTPFNSLRRNHYPTEVQGIPEFVSGFLGHLFYVNKNNYIINFL